MARVYSSEEIVLRGSLVTVSGTVLFSLFSFYGFISPDFIGAWSCVFVSLFLIMGGIGLVIPNCLSNALADYHFFGGTAGSILGFGYYVVIAIFTAFMGILHNGTVLPMPFYFLALSLLMTFVSVLLNRSRSKIKE